MTDSNKQAILWTVGTLVACVLAVGAFVWMG